MSDLKFALRSLAKSPGFTAVALLTLGLGIGASAGVFSFLNTVLLRPLPYPDSHQLLFIGERSEQVPNMSVAWPNYLDWRERQRSFAHLGTGRGQSFNLVGASETERVGGGMFSADMWPALGIAPLRGRWFNSDEDRPGAARAAVISETLWDRSFGRRDNVLGDKITLSGEIFTVVGVMPSTFRYPSSSTEVWVPFGLFAEQNMNRLNHPGLYCVGRLKPGATFESAQADLLAIARQLAREYPASNTGNSVAVQTLAERALGQQRPAVWIAFAAANGVLLIGCANIASLLLARAASRSREFAVRAALGAGRGRLIRAGLAESFLLGLGGTALGLLVGYGVMQGIKSLIPAGSPILLQTRMDFLVLAFGAVVGIGTTTLFGLVPALAGARVNLIDALAAGGRSGSGHVSARWRSVLVAGEFTLTLVLLFACGLMIRTIANLYKADLGFRTDHVATFGFVMPGQAWQEPAKRAQLLDRALARLRAVPGVSHAALTNPLPLSGGGNQTSYIIEGMADPGPGKYFSTENNAASRDYFETMRIPLVRGRLFTDEEKAGDPRVCLIDQKFADTHFAGQDPLGKRVQFGGFGSTNPTFATIIGVVGHVRNYGIGQATRVQLYNPYRQVPPASVSFVLRTTMDPAALTSTLRTAMREIEPTLPVFAFSTMETDFVRSITNQRIMLTILSCLAGLALLLAAIGLYGVLSYIVSQRTREVGIRMALGASARSVHQLMLGQGLKLALIGLAVGLLGCLGLGRLMSSQLHGVSSYDPLSLVIVSVLLATIGLLASWLPARRATRVNPVEALRAE